MTPPRTNSGNGGARGTSAGRIGSGTRVRGRVAGDGDLIVEGSVEGDIALRGDLTIGENGHVTSDIEAHEVTIAGTVLGNIQASGQVRIASGAHVTGDVKGTSVSLEEGAEFAGRLDCEFDLPPELTER